MILLISVLIVFSLWLLISQLIMVSPGTILIAEPPLIFPIFIVVFEFILPVFIFDIISADAAIELIPFSGLIPE